MNKKILSILQYLLFLGLSVFLVWWSVRGITDKGWEDIKNAFRNAKLPVDHSCNDHFTIEPLQQGIALEDINGTIGL
jgi:hypothetical protein